MAGFRLLHGVHRERADGIDAEEIEVGHDFEVGMQGIYLRGERGAGSERWKGGTVER
jgi:hypothetical protein